MPLPLRFRFAALAACVTALAATADAQDAAKKDPPKKQPAPKKAAEKRPAAPVADLTALPGFQVELLYTADPATEGSWINLTVDPKGRLLIGGQSNQPVLRATLKGGAVEKMENLGLPITQVMGMLFAFDSLYLMGSGPGATYGLFRCRDTDGDDKFDDIKALKDFGTGGEHGAHAIAAGPDGKLYVCNGNHTPVPQGLSKFNPLRNYREDHLLPRQWDGNGHAAGILAPGGYVLRGNPDGTDWELTLGGFRNQYDFAFNGDGELFTWDSDMEWDWGMPWYRPTRVNHCVTGGEYGWRSGTGVWPNYYTDSLPTTVDIGLGSPTGVTTGAGAKFPEKYQKALYICDWTYGRLMAVHLTPTGATYTGTFENFVAPKGLDGKSDKKPLNLTDSVVGKDGALYFTVGGRNTQAALYRVTYTGTESTAPATLTNADGADARKLRRELEAFHREPNPKALEFAWPHLNSDDRWIRFAA
ncbi:MAG: PQQ-dependent sugar dehydrogenase, partial [Fimbriiglobus sp.]